MQCFLELYVELRSDWRRVSFAKRPNFMKSQYGEDRPLQSIQIASVDEISNGDPYNIDNNKSLCYVENKSLDSNLSH